MKDSCIVIVRCSTLLNQLNATLFEGLCFFILTCCKNSTERNEYPQSLDTIRIKSELSLNGPVAGFFIEENRTLMYLSSTVSNPRIEVYTLSGISLDTIVLPQFPSTANPIRLVMQGNDLVYFFIDPNLLVSYNPITQVLDEIPFPYINAIMLSDSIEYLSASLSSRFMEESYVVFHPSFRIHSKSKYINELAYKQILKRLQSNYYLVFSYDGIDSNCFGLGKNLYQDRLNDSLFAFDLPYYTINAPYLYGLSPFSKEVHRIELKQNAKTEYWEIISKYTSLGTGWLSLKRKVYGRENISDILRNGGSLFRVFPSDNNQYGLIFILHDWKYDPKGRRPWSVVRIDFKTGEQREWNFSTTDLNPWSCQVYRDTLYISEHRESLQEDLIIHKYYAADF
ncbi:hypothetical protein GC167_10255 [bacterium]|nr:hypothetical protein [bacterium]